MGEKLQGGCFCGAVQFELTGEAEAMGYCHCSSCRSWSGDPIHAWTIWPQDRVSIVAGNELVGSFHKTPDSLSHRQYCTKCGGHLMISHPTLGVCDVFPGAVSELDFKPAMHINCAEWVMPVSDDLPKYKDFPAEYSDFGGTGELMPE